MAVEEEVEEQIGGRSQRWKHEAQLEWMAEEFGYDYDEMTPLDIVTVFALHRVPWRRSDRYAEVGEQHAEDVENSRAERREARRLAREAAAENGEDDEKPARGSGKGRGKTAAASKAKGGKAAKASKAPARKATSKRTSGPKGAKAKRAAGVDPFS